MNAISAKEMASKRNSQTPHFRAPDRLTKRPSFGSSANFEELFTLIRSCPDDRNPFAEFSNFEKTLAKAYNPIHCGQFTSESGISLTGF
jgi:hypothetical protein